MTNPTPHPSPDEQATLLALHELVERTHRAFEDLPSVLSEGRLTDSMSGSDAEDLADGRHILQGQHVSGSFAERVEVAFTRLRADLDAVRSVPDLPDSARHVLEHLDGEIMRRHAVVDYLIAQLERALAGVEEDVEEAAAWYEHDLYGEGDDPAAEP
jgi:hypothetical protein